MSTTDVRGSRGETVEGLKERKAWLMRQVQATDAAIERLLRKSKAPKLKPAELPGIPAKPARSLSVHEENHFEFQLVRADRLLNLGVGVIDDEKNEPAFINARMATIRKACRDDDELFALFDHFCAQDWAARYTPPYPFRAFASGKVWPAVLKEVRQQRGFA